VALRSEPWRIGHRRLGRRVVGAPSLGPEEPDEAEERLEEREVAVIGPELPPDGAADRVGLPGEPEQRERRRREAEGVPVPEKTWEAITKTAAELGVPEAMPKLG
jgi:hypothetical protein